VEFFGDEVEKIRPFTFETRLLQKEIKSFEIMPATDILVNRDEADGILFSLKRARRNSGAEAAALIDGYAEELTRNFSSPLNTFLISFLRKDFSTIYPYMSAESVLVLDDVRLIEDKLKLTRRAFCNRVDELADGGKLPRIFENGIPDYETVSDVRHRILGFGRVTSAIAFYKPNDIFDLKTSPLPSYYADMEGFFVSVKQMLILGVKIHVFARTQSSADALEKAFNEHDFGIERGFGNADARLCIGVGNVSYGFYYPVEKLLCVGINDLTRRVTVTENAQRKRAVFELPAKGDYVVHEKHGIGISEGMQKVKTLSGEKDFYVVLYRGGDRLYLPVETARHDREIQRRR
jgi:transcription-repair coupling factor (superfamily II helicase)